MTTKKTNKSEITMITMTTPTKLWPNLVTTTRERNAVPNLNKAAAARDSFAMKIGNVEAILGGNWGSYAQSV